LNAALCFFRVRFISCSRAIRAFYGQGSTLATCLIFRVQLNRIEISMDGRGRCHDNIFVERLWWTVKHEWVYLRPATNGIEQKRSLAEFFDWYNLRRPHQALSWRTPDEAYLGQSTAATALAA
jgi:putative transposase